MPSKFWTPLKVGLLTIGAVAALVAGVLLVTKGGLSSRDSYPVFAVFDDVSGLRAKTRVQIAGIEVGQIESISLVGNKAKVVLRIKNEIPLWSDAKIAKRSEGFIGDYTVDIDPGSEPPRIPPGGEIKNVVSQGEMEQVFATLGEVTKDIQSVTKSLSDVLGGPEGTGSLRRIVEDVGRLTESVNATIQDSSAKLNQILGNIQSVTESARDVATGEQNTVARILENADLLMRRLNTAADQVQGVLASVQGILGSNEGDLKEGVAGLKQSLEKLDRSLSQINEVTGKLSSGDSTLGRLLTDDTLINDIESTVDEVDDFVGRVTNLETEVTLRSDYYVNHGSSREVLNLRLKPAEDKWYDIGIVSPVALYVPQQVLLYDSQGNRRETITVTRDTALAVNALFAQRWHVGGVSLTGRFGIIESTGAVAGDVGLVDDHLKLTVEAFDFSDRYKRLPRLRAYFTYSFLDHLLVSGGVDDALNGAWVLPDSLVGTPEFQHGPRDFFLGGGLYFTDEDLKAILTIVGVPTSLP